MDNQYQKLLQMYQSRCLTAERLAQVVSRFKITFYCLVGVSVVAFPWFPIFKGTADVSSFAPSVTVILLAMLLTLFTISRYIQAVVALKNLGDIDSLQAMLMKVQNK